MRKPGAAGGARGTADRGAGPQQRRPSTRETRGTLPAARLGLGDRGTLVEGNIADLAVFDPATVTDTYAAPLSYAHGVSDVLVNGRPVLRDGRTTAQRPGLVLRNEPTPPL